MSAVGHYGTLPEIDEMFCLLLSLRDSVAREIQRITRKINVVIEKRILMHMVVQKSPA